MTVDTTTGEAPAPQQDEAPGDRRPGRIVVGVDGSELSVKALQWAADYAAMTGARIEAVTAWHFPAAYGPAPVAVYTDPEGDAARVVEAAAAAVRRDHPEVKVATMVAAGPANEVLVAQAEGADLLVIGAKGHNALARLFVGSTSVHCVSQASCAVVVVR